MKKLSLSLMLALGLSFVLFSCGDDEEDPAPVVDKKTDLDSTQFTVVTINKDITANTTWTQKKDGKFVHYVLDGVVYVKDGVVLTIQPGTLVKGKSTPSSGELFSALVVSRGGRLMAMGTATDPIVFTGTNDKITTVYDGVTTQTGETVGTWGGLVLLGKAPMESDGKSELVVEGFGSQATDATYGGTSSTDNSGSLKYVSIRHTGAEVAPGSEIQGLTLGGVGSGTTIDYVESFASADDGIEIFGGTVNIKHFVVAFADDDSYDFDFGWRGNLQFFFAIQNAQLGQDSRLGEWDGAQPDAATLYSKPNLANGTLIGPGNVSTNVSYIQIRDAFGGALINSIITDLPKTGLEVEDLEASKGVDSYGRLATDDLNILGNLWHTFNATKIDTSAFLIKGKEDKDVTILVQHLTGGNNTLSTTSLIKSYGTAERSKSLDPMPADNADLSTKFAQNVGSYTLPTGIESTTYKGAFDPNGSNWMKGWTALDKYEILK